MKCFNNLSIRSKLLVGYTTAFLFFLAVSGLILYPIVRKTIETNIENELRNTSKTILSMVKATTDASIKNYLRAVAEKNEEIVEQIYDLFKQGKLNEQEAKDRAAAILSSQHIGTTGYIYCLDSTGVMQVHPIAELLGPDLTQNDFIQKQLKIKAGYLEYEWKNPGEAAVRPKAVYMTYFKPWDWIISASSYRDEFIQLIETKAIREAILSIRFGKTGYPFIMDSSGKLIIHPYQEGQNVHDVKDANGKAFVPYASQNKNGKIFYSWQHPNESKPRGKLLIFNYIPELDWYVASSGYVEEFNQPLQLIRHIILALVITSLIVLFFLTYLYSSYMVKGLNALIHGFETGSTGDFKTRLTKTSDDEFGRIADYFNSFMGKLDAYNLSLQQEIEERKRIETSLRNSEKHLSDIIDFLPDATFVVDREGKVIIWNQAIEEMTAIKATDIVGKGEYEYALFFYGTRRPILIDLVQTADEEIENKYQHITRKGQALLAEIDVPVRGEQLTLWGMASPLYDDNGVLTGAIESIRDITERKQVEKELDTYRKHLEDLIKERTENLEVANTELSQYAYVVSHDLRAPLRAIHNYSDFLQEDLGAILDGDQKLYLESLARAIREAEMLVDDVLELARVSRRSLTFGKVDVGGLIQRLIALFALPEDVQVIQPSDWPVIEAEATLLKQIFQNLIDNAIKYNSSPKKIVELGWRPAGEVAYEFFVRDNGIGIDPSYHERIFRVFERLHTRDEYKGTGAGLAIVKKAAARLHGTVRLESEFGKGSTFFVTVPKTQKENMT